MAEWSPYGFAPPGVPGFDFRKCNNFTEIYHVAHVPDARRIIEDTKMKARLVYDESCLNKTRTHVTWLSPNHWHDGSIYGTARFNFNWEDLVRGKTVYWVEAMRYSTIATRFLVTDRDTSSIPVHSYDPATDDGPLRSQGGRWFWNSAICLEIMVDSDVLLEDCKVLDFVNHHPHICRLHNTACHEKDQSSQTSAMEVVSYLLGSGNHTVDEALTPDVGLPDGRQKTFCVLSGLNLAWLRLTRRNQFSGQIGDGPDARALVRAALMQLSLGKGNQARRLVRMLGSIDVFEHSINRILQKHFGLPNLRLN